MEKSRNDRTRMALADLSKPMLVAEALAKKYPAPNKHLTIVVSVDEKLEVTAAYCLTKEDGKQHMMSIGTSHHNDGLRIYNIYDA